MTAPYVPSRFAYQRRPSTEVRIGDSVIVGGTNPLVVQSMCTTTTQDIAATVKQSIQLAEAGCELVRITAPAVADAAALGPIRQQFSAAGFAHIPLCADIHFMPSAALEAIEHVEKVRINPGNFADKKRFATHDYTDADYAEELERIHERFSPLVLRAQELGRALRIGTNHGSLSDRIMSHYGDSPAGMVESAMEFINIAEDHNFHDIIISMKSSNPKVMVQAYRLLSARLYDHGHNYPLHLGVTEAGDGDDGRVKSAAGIGTLLEDGIGDTVRVSLTEDPVAEIPAAHDLIKRYAQPPYTQNSTITLSENIDPFQWKRRQSHPVELANGPQTCNAGGALLPLVCIPEVHADKTQEPPADLLINANNLRIITAGESNNNPCDLLLLDVTENTTNEDILRSINALPNLCMVGINAYGTLGAVRAYRFLAAALHAADDTHPICIALPHSGDVMQLASEAGALFIDGIGDAIYLPQAQDAHGLAFTVLQAVKARVTRTDYVACPSCGRTLFDLMEVTAGIKEQTDHLNGVTIAIMGCVVNGPGEMADADFGYVGSGPGKITLYRGQEAVVKNIPQTEARARLIELIKEHGMWKDPV